MIVICEPQCKSFSHEKVNSGFLYMASLAYPEDKIVFFAHISHINSIKNILEHDNIQINNIEYIPIKFNTSFSKIGLFQYELIFKKIFKICENNQTNKLLFLSFSSPILSLLKKLKQNSKYNKFKFSFVLHGDFENINENSNLNEINKDTPVDLRYRINKLKIKDIPKKLFLHFRAYIIKIRGIKRSEFGKKYRIKDVLLQDHCNDFRYIALAPYIVKNAEVYENIYKLNTC